MRGAAGMAKCAPAALPRAADRQWAPSGHEPEGAKPRFTVDAAAIRGTLANSVNVPADVLSVIGRLGAEFWLDWQHMLMAAVQHQPGVASIP